MAARTYQQDMKEIERVFPKIGPRECDATLWRAIIDVCNENDLSFMIGEAKVVTEAPYSTGTVAVTNGLSTVTLSSGTWTTSWTNRKIVISGRSEIYSVSSFGSTTTLTMSENWRGDTGSALSYFIYRDVYSLPADCELTKELLLYDTEIRERIEFVDYGEFRRTKRETGPILGIPCEVARVGLAAAGVAQVEFGPLVPNEAKVYQLDYFKSPVKPTVITDPMSPLWPIAFEDVRVKRALYEFAKAKGNPRRFELKQDYESRIVQMMAKFDGGNEMRRRIRGTTARSRGGIGVYARWTGA